MRTDILERIKATGKPFKIFTDYVEDDAMTQFTECLEQPSVVKGALMPDTHSGYVAPIGSVLLTQGTIFPSFVGYDIGCGLSACVTNIHKDVVTNTQLEGIKEEILKVVPIGFKRHEKPQDIPINIKSMPMTKFAKDILLGQGTTQIGTLGGGNHFLEIGTNNNGMLSIVIHSGSRGVGHKIATHYMREAAVINTDEDRYATEFDKRNKGWLDKTNSNGATITIKEKYEKAKKEFIYRRVRARVDNIEGTYPLATTTPLGKDYINDMNMALEFALANRELMVDNVLSSIEKVLGVPVTKLDFINRNHNHAELTDEGWVHRKGATHAEKGMLGVIPANMVDGSFIVKGKGNKDSLCSSSHGAGRVLSRRKAKEQLDLQEFKDSTKHLVANHSDSNLDEAPKAYKDIHEVMANQSELIEILDRITPILNIKG
jgi:tRNA-splicing ligase RtcB